MGLNQIHLLAFNPAWFCLPAEINDPSQLKLCRQHLPGKSFCFRGANCKRKLQEAVLALGSGCSHLLGRQKFSSQKEANHIKFEKYN